MTTPIQSLNLTRRATNCLLAEGMTTVEQVAAFTREHGMNGLLRIPNLGRKWANEVMAAVGVEHQTPKRRNDGGPAFPVQEPQAIHAYAIAAIDGITDPDERDRAYTNARAEAVGGATLRDYFATHCVGLDADCSIGLATQLAATQGMEKPSDNKDVIGWHRFWCAVHAAHRYMMADAMLAARKAGTQ